MEMGKRTEEYVQECIAYTLGLPVSVTGLAERLAAAEEAQRESVKQGLQLQEKLRLAKEEAALNAGAVRKYVAEVEHWQKECALYLHDRELFMEAAEEAEERANDANQQAIQVNNELQRALIQIEQLEQENRELRMLLKIANTVSDSGVVISKEADVDATKRKKSVSLTASFNPKVVGDKKQASKAELNSSTVTITSKKEASANRAPKRASSRTPHREYTRHQNDNLTPPKKKTEKKQPESKKGGDAARSTFAGHQKDNLTPPKKKTEKKQPESKKGGDAARSTSARSHKSASASRLNNKENGVDFSFKSDERAEKRIQFYMKLEEKMNAEEAEMNRIQAKTQEGMEAKIKQPRKRLNFKVTPMPTFYQETSSTKSENKKVSQISAKTQNLGRKNTTSGTDSDSSTVPTHKTISIRGVKNNRNPLKKQREAQPDSSVTSYVNNAHKEAGSRNLSPGKPLKSKPPDNANRKREPIHHG